MSKPGTPVIPIRQDVEPGNEPLDIAVELAYSLWASRGFRNGSIEQHLLTALLQMERPSRYRPLLVPRHQTPAAVRQSLSRLRQKRQHLELGILEIEGSFRLASAARSRSPKKA